MSRRTSGQNNRLTRLVVGSLACLLVLVVSFQHFYSLRHPQKHFLVKLLDDPIFRGNSVGQDAVDKVIASDGLKVEDLFPTWNVGEVGKWVVVTGEEKTVKRDLEDLWNDCEIQDYESDMVMHLIDPITLATAQDKLEKLAEKDKTWGIRLSKTKEGLSVLKPIRQVLVAVVDTGMDLNHPALKDSLVKGHNFAGGNVEDPSNRNANEMHATHVAGTIVAKPDSEGFYGIANTVAKVMPVRVLNESGSGTLINVARGIEYAADQNADVINMSLGGPGYSRALHDSVKYAVAKGVTVVCAKGNSNTDKAFYPAEFPEVIRVTATALREDGTEERAYFSNYGKSSTCAAPGHFIYSSLPGGKYGFASGTSMACPHAAACAAVLLSQGKLTPEEVKAIIENRGDVLKTDKEIGKRINLLKFVQKAAHDKMPLVNNHPYGQCCVDAGIVSRSTSSYGPNGEIETVYQDSDGTYDSICEDHSGTTVTHRSAGSNDWTMTFTPKSGGEIKEVSPVSYASDSSDWCYKCLDYHQSNKVCSGVRVSPAKTYSTPTEVRVTDWCSRCGYCHRSSFNCTRGEYSKNSNPAVYLLH